MEDITAGRVTLGQVFAQYTTHRTPRKRSATSRQADARRVEMWMRVLGGRKDPHRITLGEWERFIDARSSGSIDSRGNPVEEGKRKAVRARSVEADCKWLRWALGWAARWRTTEGRYLLRENPVRGFDTPTELNPRRPVATEDRYRALLKVSDQVGMEVRWNGKRTPVRSYLTELLTIANGTGRRLSAIVRLTYDDLRLDAKPHGAIRWPADTDKQGREWVVPISPAVRAALLRVTRERPGIGSAPLFPSPKDPQKPIRRHLADQWLREVEWKAKLEPQQGSAWHAFRRKWATEWKHLPATDVAAAGGWAGPETLQRAYMQADPETMLRVVLDAGELREVR